MSLTVQTTKGILWSGSSQAARQILQIGITAILARLLTPADFGVLAMVTVFTSFIALFSELGLGAALVQRKGVTEAHLSTAFWMTLLAGAALMILTMASSPLVAWFYGRDRLTPIVLVISVNFLIGATGAVPQALLQRNMEFGRLALIENGALLGSGLAAIFLAWRGWGVWSLVGQSVVSVSLTAGLAWSLSGWRPRWLFRRSCLRELWGFSSHLLGFNVLHYAARNLDNLLIGKFLGATALGYYTLAYRLMMLPLQNVSWVLGRVLFPAFARIQTELARVRHNYIRLIRYISLLTFPMMAGMAVVAPELIRILYGNQWERAIFLVRVLCLVGLLQSVGTTVGTIYLSQGRSDIMLKWNLFFVPIVCSAILVGLRWDVEGVAVAYATVGIVFWYVPHFIANRLIDLDARTFLRALVPAGAAAAIMALLLSIWRWWPGRLLMLETGTSLAVQVVLGAGIYAGLLGVAHRGVFGEIAGLLRQLLESRRTREIMA